MNNDSGSLIAQRRRLLASITEAESKIAAREYNWHVRVCRQSDVPAAPFGTWLTEWLECHRQPAMMGEVDEPAIHDARDYNKMFSGKRGFEG